jgi:hypothetical protein
VARILIVGGGCRGRRLAREMAGAGHAVRITTRSKERRSEIEASGAECWLGTPERLGGLRAALDGVTVACWMLARAAGPAAEVRSLHGSRLELFLRYVIDTTVRGFVYDASPGVLSEPLLEEGAEVTRSLTRQHAIPARVLVHGDGAAGDDAGWVRAAREAVEGFLGASGEGGVMPTA